MSTCKERGKEVGGKSAEVVEGDEGVSLSRSRPRRMVRGWPNTVRPSGCEEHSGLAMQKNASMHDLLAQPCEH